VELNIEQYQPQHPSKRTRQDLCARPVHTKGDHCAQHTDNETREHNPVIVDPYALPMIMPYPLCLICLYSPQLPWKTRTKRFLRKDVLYKHFKAHSQDLRFQSEFRCLHPSCTVDLKPLNSHLLRFQRHAKSHHGVF
jgi:hypothetical protein